MNREMKRVGGLMILLFASLFVASSIIQVFQSDALHNDARNQGTVLDGYDIKRGQILLADGKAIVTSKPTNDKYKYLRTYTNPKVYSSVTGFSPISGEATGIEGALNGELAGTSSSQFFDRLKSTVTGQDPQGDSVQLTIEPKVQQAAYDALGKYTGAVVALNVKTGAVLAMVSKPTYDPNVLAKHDIAGVDTAYSKLVKAASNPLVNRAVGGDLDPPGSTFKLVVASAALESGKYTADSAFKNPASLTLSGTTTTIHNSDKQTCGSGKTATIATAIRLSCNIPFAELGGAVGENAISEMAKKYGFGQELAIPIAVTPSVYPTGLSASELQQSAFGQVGDRATVLQMAMVSAGIANKGVLMKPNLVEKILSPSLDTVQKMTPTQLSQPISAATADSLTKMMIAGVDNGAASNARIDGVQVAGKTGTAQNGTTDPYTLWFTGFAPANDPEVAVAVVVEDGGGLGQSGYGNLLAAPIAKRVIEAVLNK